MPAQWRVGGAVAGDILNVLHCCVGDVTHCVHAASQRFLSPLLQAVCQKHLSFTGNGSSPVQSTLDRNCLMSTLEIPAASKVPPFPNGLPLPWGLHGPLIEKKSLREKESNMLRQL